MDTTPTVGTKFRACLLLFHLTLWKIPCSDTFFLPLEYWTMDHVQEPSDTISVCNVPLVGTLRTDFLEKYIKQWTGRFWRVLLRLDVRNKLIFLLPVFFIIGGGDSPASEFYVPTFRNTLFHLHRWWKQEDSCLHHICRWKRQSIYTPAYKIQTPGNHIPPPKKKEYNIHNRAKVWNQE
jgi:hypothetical protein